MKLPTNGNQRILIGILPALFLTDDFLCMATTGGVFHTRTTGLFRGGSHHQGSCPQRPGSGHARVPAPDHLLGALHFLAENLHQLVGGFLQSNGAKEDLKKITCDCACCRPLLPKAYRDLILRAVSRVGRRFPPPSKNARRYDGSRLWNSLTASAWRMSSCTASIGSPEPAVKWTLISWQKWNERTRDGSPVSRRSIA